MSFIIHNIFAELPFDTPAAKMMIDHQVEPALGKDYEAYDPYVIGSMEDEDVMEGVLELLQGDDLSDWQAPNDNMSSMYIPEHTKASALPISVTTELRGDPSVPSRLFNLQLATGLVTSPKQSQSPVAYTNVRPHPALAGPPHDGFTLPSSFGLAMAALNSSTSQPTASVPSLRASAASPLQGYSSDPSDSRASMNALDIKTSAGRRRRSASEDELTPGKNKYRKVEGRKITTSMSMVRPLLRIRDRISILFYMHLADKFDSFHRCFRLRCRLKRSSMR